MSKIIFSEDSYGVLIYTIKNKGANHTYDFCLYFYISLINSKPSIFNKYNIFIDI